MIQKLDVLVLSVHPDDAELGCGGTVIKMVAEGKKVGIIDLTRGELGSRGSAKIRATEAAEASKIMGIHVRDNLGFRDGFFTNDESHQLAIIQAIRNYQPEIIITNAPKDRHPDHGRASNLVRDASFLSGLRKIETNSNGKTQEHWRPKKVFFFIQDTYLQPDFVIDITPYHEQKMQAIQAYGTQFYNPTHKEPQTYISTGDFLNFLEARARTMGHFIGATFGEGFISESPLKIDSPLSLT